MIESLVIHVTVNPMTLRNEYRLEVLKDRTYEDLSRAVGGLIEPVPTSPDVTIWVNEEGKYRNPTPNIIALDVWRRCDVYECVPAGDWIAGSVVIEGGALDGEPTTCPQWVRDMFPDAGWEHLIVAGVES